MSPDATYGSFWDECDGHCRRGMCGRNRSSNHYEVRGKGEVKQKPKKKNLNANRNTIGDAHPHPLNVSSVVPAMLIIIIFRTNKLLPATSSGIWAVMLGWSGIFSKFIFASSHASKFCIHIEATDEKACCDIEQKSKPTLSHQSLRLLATLITSLVNQQPFCR